MQFVFKRGFGNCRQSLSQVMCDVYWNGPFLPVKHSGEEHLSYVLPNGKWCWDEESCPPCTEAHGFCCGEAGWGAHSWPSLRLKKNNSMMTQFLHQSFLLDASLHVTFMLGKFNQFYVFTMIHNIPACVNDFIIKRKSFPPSFICYLYN